MTIPEISQAEGLSIPNVAKLMRLLRMGGLVKSVRGQAGGYTLARAADKIMIGEVLDLLGGQFFGPHFCDRHAGRLEVCRHSEDCSLRCLWSSIQGILQQVLGRTSLQDAICSEKEMAEKLAALSESGGLLSLPATAAPWQHAVG